MQDRCGRYFAVGFDVPMLIENFCTTLDVRLVREDLQRGIPKGWFLCGGMPGTYRASGALPGFLVDWATSIHHTTKPTTTEEAKHCRHTRSRFRREYLAFRLYVKILGTSDPRLSLPISWLRSRARK